MPDVVSPHNPGEVFQVEREQDDGSTKFITVNPETNTRFTHTSKGDDDEQDRHITRQDEPKHSPDRH